MKRIFLIALTVMVIAGVSTVVWYRDWFPEDLGGGYYYKGVSRELVYDPSSQAGDSLPEHHSLVKDITAYKNSNDYIIVRKKIKAGAGVDHTDIYYYIIDKRTHSLSGPYLYDTFLSRCTTLGISIF